MNIFTYLGDLLHLASFFVVFLKIYTTKSCNGVSLKTQEMYVLVFLTRYVDILYNFRSLYLWAMKIIFITISLGIVYMMRLKMPYCKSYDKRIDDFNVWYVYGPCLILAMVWNEAFTPTEILWAFSYFLEAVAIFPQLFVVQKLAKSTGGFVETLTSHYVFSLGGYRFFYLLNWIFRFITEKNYWHPLIWFTGVVQTALFSDFCYYYIRAQLNEDKLMKLPI